MKLYYTFSNTTFLDAQERQYGKFNMFAFPAISPEEAETLTRNETARRIADAEIKDNVLHMKVGVQEVPADSLAIVFWAMVDGQRLKFLSDIIIRLAKMGEDVEQLRSVVEGAIQEYQDEEGITGA